jgi:hypothetical protein
MPLMPMLWHGTAVGGGIWSEIYAHHNRGREIIVQPLEHLRPNERMHCRPHLIGERRLFIVPSFGKFLRLLS